MKRALTGGCGFAVPLLELHSQHGARAEGDRDCDPRFGLVQLQTRQGLYALDTIRHRIDVNTELASGRAAHPAGGSEGLESLQQRCVPRLCVLQERAQELVDEAAQRIRALDLE